MRVWIVGLALVFASACTIEGEGSDDNSACQGWIRAMGDCLVAAGQQPSGGLDACNAYLGQDQYFLCMQHAYEMDDCSTDEGLNNVLAETAACEELLDGGATTGGSTK